MADTLLASPVPPFAPPPQRGPDVVRVFVERLRVPSLIQPEQMSDTIWLDAHPATLPHVGLMVRTRDVPNARVEDDLSWHILVSGLGGLDLAHADFDLVGLRLHLAGAVNVQPGFTYYAARLLGPGSLRTGAGAGIVWKGPRP